jgi:hypothetical protein
MVETVSEYKATLSGLREAMVAVASVASLPPDSLEED